VKENDEDTANRHAAQFFAEMLGQACHSEFYDDMDNEYQEVFLQSLSLTIVLRNSYSTYQDLLILRQVTQSISLAHFRTWS